MPTSSCAEHAPSAARPSPGWLDQVVVNFSQRVTHGGLQFQLQTEIVPSKGIPVVSSQLYFDGCVVASREHDLSEVVEPEAVTQARTLARSHHRRLIRDLRQGALDERIAETPGTGEFKAITDAVVSADSDSHRTAEAKQHFKRGLKLLAEAVDAWLEAVKLDPTNTRLQGICDEVFQSFERVKTVAAPPSQSKSDVARRACAHEYFAAGITDVRAGRLMQALVAWNWATALDPNNETIRTNLSSLRRRLANLWAGYATRGLKSRTVPETAGVSVRASTRRYARH